MATTKNARFRLGRQASTSTLSVVLVGASRGLGLDLARLYGRRGAKISLCARDPAEVGRAVAELEATGVDAFGQALDAADPREVSEFIERVLSSRGRIDILITCAATIQVGPLEAMTRGDFVEALDEIFWTTYTPTMAVLPSMRARGSGKIVHIGSIGGKVAIPHMAPYSAAKFAVNGFSQAVRAEVAHQGIQVTTINPGLMRTGAQMNVPFKGRVENEFVWFASGVTFPFVSISSEKAARKIVRAVDRGVAESALVPLVRAATIANAVAPKAIAKMLSFANRFLPSSRGGIVGRETGQDVVARSRSRIVAALAALGKRNAEKHHQYPGPTHVGKPRTVPIRAEPV